MRSEGFLFLSGGSGGGTVFVPIFKMMSLTFARVRARPRCARCAVPLGLASTGVAWAELCVAVPWGLVGRACLTGVAWPQLGVAVPWGLVGRAWSGRRCAVVVGAESLVWAVLCRCDWWGEPGLGGAVPL